MKLIKMKKNVCFSNYVKTPISFGLLFLSDRSIILEINRWFFLIVELRKQLMLEVMFMRFSTYSP